MPAMLLPALAAALSSAPSSAPVTVAVPTGRGAQDVVVMERTIPVGGETGWHTHPGYEICHVVSGRLEVHTDGGVTPVGPGQTSVIARGALHDAVNVGSVPAVLAVTFVVEHGRPTRSDAAAPHG